MSQRYPKPGDRVNIIQKKHYGTGELTTGVVGRVLTRARFHSRGHKVRLEDGTIGRVQSFVDLPCRSTHGRAKAGEVGEYEASDLPGPDDLR